MMTPFASDPRPNGSAPKQGGGGNGGGQNDKDPSGPGPKAPGRGFFAIAMVAALAVVLFLFFNASSGGNAITLKEFTTYYNDGVIVADSVAIHDSEVRAIAKPGYNGDPDVTEQSMVRVPFNAATAEEIARQVIVLTENQVTIKRTPNWVNGLIALLPLVFLVLLVMFLISRSLRNAAGGGGMLGNFGKSKHKMLSKEMTGVTFQDVAGIDEAKEEVTEIIEFLRNPKKFTKLGGRIPRGVLLIGDPGCGKTLLAKAIAGEADVPFFSISGSDFVEMFVGVGASRVRDLFKQAKDNSPCIIFLDEIDAVGRRRGGGFSQGGHDEREQTLNAILVEMDGFNSGDGVIVVAATNRADVLDPALIRPGRFDRQVNVPLPDLKGRLEILKVHADKVKLGPDVDLERMAKMTPMFSGADLAGIINEAAISATMHAKDFIEQEDFEEARDKVKFGRAKKGRHREAEENKLVAYHEAGHAILQAELKDADPLHKVTIIPRGGAGGATFSLPDKDRMGYSLKWLNATMRVLCGGRIAEARAMQDASSGAAQDISQVTQLARTMVLEWGMSDKLGFIRYSGSDTREMFAPDKDYSDHTAQIIDDEVRRLVDEAYTDAGRILDENWHKVDDLASSLLKYETLSGDEVHQIMRGEALNKPSVADLLQREARKPAAAPRSDEPETDTPPGAVPSPA
ncbi:MAG: ATP-dependent zinc metalloprotease FtsH [Planctomycetota bacterium]